jgi:purine-nucleoside/S-methyl-5'-thioadenosine phosphorylase / adenosine deaminase
MEWRESGGVRWLEVDLPGASAVFSTRSAGSAKEDVGPLAAALDVDPRRILSGRQVHGTDLAFHDTVESGSPQVDGHVLTKPGPIGLVYTADCLPVAVAGRGGVAILHCGWRGLASGMIDRGAEAVGATHAAIGPGIGPCCYEVGDEVLAAFAQLGDGIVEGRMLDLTEVARRLLARAGVGEVEATGLCTCCEQELFFSHRRDGGPGRQGGLAWIDGTVT